VVGSHGAGVATADDGDLGGGVVISHALPLDASDRQDVTWCGTRHIRQCAAEDPLVSDAQRFRYFDLQK
jgi:hypothetical protein